MKIFERGNLRTYFGAILDGISNMVHSEDRNWLLNVSEDEYIQFLVEKHRIDPLVLYWDGMTTSDKAVQFSHDQVPSGLPRQSRGNTERQVITYHIPFTGNRALLSMRPAVRLAWSIDVRVVSNEVEFDVVNWDNLAEMVKKKAERITSRIRQAAKRQDEEIARFNDQLEARVSAVVRDRKSEYLERIGVLTELGVPIRRAADVPTTFVIPKIKKRATLKPVAPIDAFTPEPTLEDSVYGHIVKLCHDIGVEMERHPSIYFGRNEEMLRDIFILMLSPHFESVTGETFNRRGHTDILVRHEGANLFVAECKFWRGSRAFLKAIDQTLGYLTWRDSKALIILFIQNQKLQPVLDKVGEFAQEHECFVGQRDEASEGLFAFNFHLLEDPSRGIRLSVLCLHFPETSS